MGSAPCTQLAAAGLLTCMRQQDSRRVRRSMQSLLRPRLGICGPFCKLYWPNKSQVQLRFQEWRKCFHFSMRGAACSHCKSVCHKVLTHFLMLDRWQLFISSLPSSPSAPHLGKLIRKPGFTVLWSQWEVQTTQAPAHAGAFTPALPRSCHQTL